MTMAADTAGQDDYDSEEEGMQLLLGGLGCLEMSKTEWAEEEAITKPTFSKPSQKIDSNGGLSSPVPVQLVDLNMIKRSNEHIENAYRLSKNGTLEKPPVQIVDMSSINNRGNSLVATRCISKGETIFVEKAAVASTMPHHTVPACYQCWKSLATVSNLPEPQLWPVVREIQVTCPDCQATFCSNTCQRSCAEEFGNCCKMKQCVECANEEATVLATRRFVHAIQRHRTGGQIGFSSVRGMCGDASDLDSLEVGSAKRHENGSITYSIASLYQNVANILSLSKEELRDFSEDFLACLVSICSRNGIGTQTASPFGAYYSALMRHAGGRGTSKHEQYLQELSNALGSEDGTLTRTMDKAVQEKVCYCETGNENKRTSLELPSHFPAQDHCQGCGNLCIDGPNQPLVRS